MSFTSILIAILMFGLLIFIHELGHFIVARLCGVKILEFAIGMGPKLFSVKSKKSGTAYSLRLFPIGGYVSMYGEDGMQLAQGSAELPDSEKEKSESAETVSDGFLINQTTDGEKTEEVPPVDPELAKQAYCNQSVWRRILISIAGPLMNILLGFLLMFIYVIACGSSSLGTTEVGGFYVQYNAEETVQGFLNGDYISFVGENQINSFEDLMTYADGKPVTVFVLRQDPETGVVTEEELPNVTLTDDFLTGSFIESLSAAKLQRGDEIIKVNSTRVHTYNELFYEITNQGYKPVTLTVIRDGEKLKLENVIFPSYADPDTGIVFGDFDFKVFRAENFNFGVILKETWYRSWSTIKMVYDSIKGFFVRRYGIEAVSGPIGITKTISTVAETSMINVLYLVTVISINLGVMNLLPLPALDGGHLLIYVVEIIRRKPLKREVEGIINFVGLILILALAVLVAIKDIIAL